MESTFQFPTVAASDPSDVAVAIETANALWRRGEPQESLRWLRRAAESAEAEGDDMRALSLARAAADMMEEMRPSAPPPASQRPAAAARSTASAAPAPRSAAPPPRSVTPAPRSVAPAPPSSASPARASVPPAPKLEPWRPPAEAATPPAPAVVDKATGVVALEGKAAAAAVRAAVRVSVEPSGKGARTLLVRVLGEGEALPAGATEALLVPTSPGVDFTAKG